MSRRSKTSNGPVGSGAPPGSCCLLNCPGVRAPLCPLLPLSTPPALPMPNAARRLARPQVSLYSAKASVGVRASSSSASSCAPPAARSVISSGTADGVRRWHRREGLLDLKDLRGKLLAITDRLHVAHGQRGGCVQGFHHAFLVVLILA